MKKFLLPTILLVAYIIILIKVMVFKDVPMVKIGQLMLNFGGTDAGHSSNFIPFVTIVPYLFGSKGLVIGGINIIGNIILLIPLGFLLPYLYRHISPKISLIIAILSSLAIEVMQVILKVGIFDIDDVILNALGFMIGYWIFVLLSKFKYRNVILIVVLIIAVIAYVKSPISFAPAVTQENVVETSDLCGGTGGNGEVINVGVNTFTLKRKDIVEIIVSYVDKSVIKPSGELKIGDRVTLVGDMNADNTFRADAVLICNK